MRVKVKKLTPEAVIPSQAKDGDFCYDVVATSCEEVEPGIWKYGLGLVFELERPSMTTTVCTAASVSGDFVSAFFGPGVASNPTLDNILSNSCATKLSLDFRPRSSIWKTGLILSNCVGTIDELYRGEVLAYFYEVIPGKEKYKVGDRIGQIKLGITVPLEFYEDANININTARGTGGFGSTGK